MKRRWMAWSMVMALSLAPIAGQVWAQEPPPPPEGAPGADLGPGALDDHDDLAGLDALLAADMADGAGEGGPGMAPGAGGRGFGGRRAPGAGRGAGRAQELRAKLNVTQDQKTRLADIRDRQAREAIPIQGDLRLAHLDMRRLMRADKPDLRAIEAQIDKISGLRARLQKARVASRLEARALLTPAQQKILREQGGRRHLGMMGHRMDRGPGARRMRMGL